MHNYTFPENLRRIRKEQGLTQKDLADMLNLGHSSISNYERCLRYPTLDRVYDMARVLNVSPEDLIAPL